MPLKFKRHEENRDEPGYLRRRMNAMGFFDALEGEPSVANLNAVVEFLLDHVEAPKNRKRAREQILDLSEEQYAEALRAILAQPGQVPPEQSGGSENG